MDRDAVRGAPAKEIPTKDWGAVAVDVLLWLLIPLIAAVCAGVWAVGAQNPRRRRGQWQDLDRYDRMRAALAPSPEPRQPHSGSSRRVRRGPDGPDQDSPAQGGAVRSRCDVTRLRAIGGRPHSRSARSSRARGGRAGR